MLTKEAIEFINDKLRRVEIARIIVAHRLEDGSPLYEEIEVGWLRDLAEHVARYEAALREILRHCEDPNIPAVDVWSAVWDLAREALKEPAR